MYFQNCRFHLACHQGRFSCKFEAQIDLATNVEEPNNQEVIPDLSSPIPGRGHVIASEHKFTFPHASTSLAFGAHIRCP